VIQVYEMHVLRGLTVDEIAGKYESLEREAVIQAIRYAISHPDFVREQSTSKLTVNIAERQKSARESASA
jgi:uncharacterized protein (DUF433 family)